mmetsp:Transcript_28980/g.21565  ORF Transcript_28980/g.21565 Transcript_28980/m.21565 type:complete len:117 (-) Transcript_28980:1155-1505(-)
MNSNLGVPRLMLATALSLALAASFYAPRDVLIGLNTRVVRCYGPCVYFVCGTLTEHGLCLGLARTSNTTVSAFLTTYASTRNVLSLLHVFCHDFIDRNLTFNRLCFCLSFRVDCSS